MYFVCYKKTDTHFFLVLERISFLSFSNYSSTIIVRFSLKKYENSQEKRYSQFLNKDTLCARRSVLRNWCKKGDFPLKPTTHIHLFIHTWAGINDNIQSRDNNTYFTNWNASKHFKYKLIAWFVIVNFWGVKKQKKKKIYYEALTLEC